MVEPFPPALFAARLDHGAHCGHVGRAHVAPAVDAPLAPAQGPVRPVRLAPSALAAGLAARLPGRKEGRNLGARFRNIERRARGAGVGKESLFAPRAHRRRRRPGHGPRCVPLFRTRWQVGQTTGPVAPPPRQAGQSRHVPATIASRSGSNSAPQRRQVVVMMVMTDTPSTVSAGLDQSRPRTQDRGSHRAASGRRVMPRSRPARNCHRAHDNAPLEHRARAQGHHHRHGGAACRTAGTARRSRPSSGHERTR